MIGGISSVGQYYGHAGYMQAGAVERGSQIQDGESAASGGQSVSMDTPVKQAQPIPVIQSGSQNQIPFLRKGADPAEMAVRMRIQYGEAEQSETDAGISGVQKALEEGKCETCEERKYQDGSDDSGVSYQTPTHIAPEQAASAVRGHEMEHVVRENAKAQREERKVVSQSVTLHTAICPECGKPYISGGTTRTTTAAETQPKAEEFTQTERTPFSAVA